MGQQVYSLARLAQPLMVISLFLIFLKLFAWDAVKRFNREEVMVQVEIEEAESLDTPAVTICVDLVSNSFINLPGYINRDPIKSRSLFRLDTIECLPCLSLSYL